MDYSRKFTRSPACDDMIFWGRKFKAAWWSVWLTVIGVILFVSLGQWQLERAAYKDSIKQKFEQRLKQEYQVFNAGDSLDDLEFRKLILEGQFDNAHSFLVDNQIHQGKAGYHVLTPVQLANSDRIILVNRGWVQWGPSRERLPDIPQPLGSGRVAGIAKVPDEQGFRLGKVELGDNWPQVIPFIDIAALQRQFSDQLLPLILWLAPDQQGHYIRVWAPVWADPEKSRAYATQWFSFALISCVLFIGLNLRKVE